ncbi:hypothetical protein JCM16303_001672 [Sporobolomyces ruberrimus]
MTDSLSSSLGSLDINQVDLTLVVSALESIGDSNVNAAEIAEELVSLGAIYDIGSSEPPLKLFRPAPTARKPSPPPDWTPSSSEPLRLILSTTLAPPHDETPVHLLLSIPYPNYPTSEPPLIQLHDRYLGKFQVSDELFGQVLRTFMHDNEAGTASGVEWTGSVCLFEGIELVKEVCTAWILEQEEEKQRGEDLRQEAAASSEASRNNEGHQSRGGEEEDGFEEGRNQESSFARRTRKAPVDDVPCPEIYSTEGLLDRKSLFVAHAARVKSMAEVDAVMSTLLANNKIAKATHNISAYHFIAADGIKHSDNDDDGEKAAGSTLASLLEKIAVQDIIVVVSRWYGGIHLGADRFKDINQAARDALVEGGFLPESADKSKSKTSGKHSNGRNGTKR